MRARFSVVLLLGVVSTLHIAPENAESAQNSAREVRERIRKEFVNSTVVLVQEGVYAGPYTGSPETFTLGSILSDEPRVETALLYYRPSVDQLAKNRRQLEGLTPLKDGRTFQQINRNYGTFRAAPSPILPLDEGLHVLDMTFTTFSGEDVIYFVLKADQVRHGGPAAAGTRQVKNRDGKLIVAQAQWGLQFVLSVGKDAFKKADYDALMAEIRQVLVPAREAEPVRAAQKGLDSKAVAVADSPTTNANAPSRSSNITVGMSRDEVVKTLGQPKEVVTFGSRELLRYDAFSIVVENGKVVDVKF